MLQCFYPDFYVDSAYDIDYERLYEQYNGEIPDSVKEEFYAAADKDRLNIPNGEFLEHIEKFYDDILDGQK